MKIPWKKADNRIEVIDNIVLVCLIIFGLFLHCYRLGSLPRGLYVDEMGMAYDAWSLGHFGVDRYLKSWPVYLTNFGGGQSILYCYLDIPFILLGGMTPYMIRMPALIFSLITGAGGFFLIKNEKGKQAFVRGTRAVHGCRTCSRCGSGGWRKARLRRPR